MSDAGRRKGQESRCARAMRVLRCIARFAFAVASLTLFATHGVFAADVRLLSGTDVELVLQQHITSFYTPADTPVFFRVAKDVVVDGHVLIRGGTLVSGRMSQAADRRAAGISGSMTFGVRFVPTVDGENARIIANTTREGRDRGGALAGWTAFWGLPGLVTRGVNPYMLRGTTMYAQVLTERRVRIDGEASPPNVDDASPPATEAAISRVTFADSKAKVFRYDIERSRPLTSVTLSVALPAQETLASLALVRVDGLPIPAAVGARDVHGNDATFGAWSLLQFCRDGTTELGFEGTTSNGTRIRTVHAFEIRIDRKKP